VNRWPTAVAAATVHPMELWHHVDTAALLQHLRHILPHGPLTAANMADTYASLAQAERGLAVREETVDRYSTDAAAATRAGWVLYQAMRQRYTNDAGRLGRALRDAVHTAVAGASECVGWWTFTGRLDPTCDHTFALVIESYSVRDVGVGHPYRDWVQPVHLRTVDLVLRGPRWLYDQLAAADHGTVSRYVLVPSVSEPYLDGLVQRGAVTTLGFDRCVRVASTLSRTERGPSGN
jgi:hypothetical protein